MSHKATNWAIQQRGLKPASKIVLWHLADCHNPASGCFPSQAYLADVCEMSRSTLNEHLNLLEQKGLIRRVQSLDEHTKRRLPTNYILGFEAEVSNAAENSVAENSESEIRTRGRNSAQPRKAVSEIRTRDMSGNRTRAMSEKRGEPCPDLPRSHVRKPDYNLVNKPVNNPRAREAAPIFTDDERLEAKDLADCLHRGVPVQLVRVPKRVKACLIAENMLPADDLKRTGLC
ncbi:helix-turn-helix domain-containing protein [Paenirhodobacter enshiensis]|uniref:helix-turn-helix domain-containing protein n=1 Tax=Paenirhodobacter enshiensis TaxID=1105367 RepID=UPI003FA1AFE9